MSKLTRANGNMYPWVTHMISFLQGGCGHGCSYCYVRRSPRLRRRCQGPLTLDGEALNVPLGNRKVIFIEHLNDLFQEGLPEGWRRQVLERCQFYPRNQYVFQTKNPTGYLYWLHMLRDLDCLLGTTIESDICHSDFMGNAPHPRTRWQAMLELPRKFKIFVTMLDFNLAGLCGWLRELRPNFINVGADSKGSGLPEPRREKVLALISTLRADGMEVRVKGNLERIVGKGDENHRGTEDTEP